MELILNIIGFIIALMVALFATTNIALTLFKQIPFMNRLKRLGVIRDGSMFWAYFFRIVLAVIVIGGMFLIPSAAVTWGVLIGIFFGLRGLFNSSLKNDMYVDFVNGMEYSSTEIDQDKFEIFADTVKGIDAINNFISHKSNADLENAKNHYGLSDTQIQKYTKLTVEGNKIRQRMVQIFTAMRDELLANDSSLWEKIADKYYTSELEQLEANVKSITEQQQDILHAS